MIPARSDLRALKGYHSAQVDVDVRLNTNESPLPPPKVFRRALTDELSTVNWHRYPDRHATELRSAIAAFHGVTPDMVFAANGSNEVLQTLILTYAGPSGRIGIFEPTYQMHGQIARVLGTEVIAGRRRDDYTLDPAELTRIITTSRPDIIFATSPNNPTGLVEPRERIEEMVAMAPGIVVVDEAYAQFSDWTALDLVGEDTPLVVTRTFSKTWSMAGLRLGYAIGPTWLIEELNKAVLPYHLDAGKQIAGRLAFDYVDQMEDRVRLIVAERERISDQLADLDLDVTPSGANFVLFRPRSMDAHQVWQHLVDRSILVRDCSTWPHLDNCLRVTVGNPVENDAFLSALADVLTGGDS